MLRKLFEEWGTGDGERITRHVEEFSVIGVLAGPGSCAVQPMQFPPFFRGDVTQGSSWRCSRNLKKPSPLDDPLGEGAEGHATRGLLGGPRPFRYEGNLFANGPEVEVTPASRFGAQQGRELGAVSDLEMRSTCAAAAVHGSIKLPSRDHGNQVAKQFRKMGRRDR